MVTNLILGILLSVAYYTVLSGVIFIVLQFFVLKKKCTGSIHTDGCGKTMYPYKLKSFFINQYKLIFFLLTFQYKKIKKFAEGSEFKADYGITVNKKNTVSYLCKDCIDVHDAHRVANRLMEA